MGLIRGRRRPSSGQIGCVLGAIALFIALGGPSYAAKLINGHSIKKGTIEADRLSAKARKSLRGQQGDEGPAGPRGATGAQGVQGDQGPAGPTGAPGAKGDKGDAGQNGTNATVNGVAAGGALTGTYPSPGLAPAEAVRLIGAANQPAFTATCGGGSSPCWQKLAAANPNDPGFWRDPYGVVHLQGVVESLASSNNTVMFVLPAGYRSGHYNYFAIWGQGGATKLSIDDVGEVFPTSLNAGLSEYFSLDGVSFRCAPSGSNGCP